jgi:hypothetical protein
MDKITDLQNRLAQHQHLFESSVSQLETAVHGNHRVSEILAEMTKPFSYWAITKKMLRGSCRVAFPDEKHNICKINLSRFTVEESKNSQTLKKTYK